MEVNLIYNSECRLGLKRLPDNSVNCCVTSPPYFGLRDYGNDAQIGLEATPEEYIKKLVEVFREVRRVLTADGTLWVNIGDSYNGSGKAGKNPNYIGKHKTFGKVGNPNTFGVPVNIKGLKSKDLIGIPWMLAFALRADGWYLRQDIIWSKPNPMPESVRDRCTKSHEYIFLLSKSRLYYFDAEAIKVPARESTMRRVKQDVDNQVGSSRSLKTNGNMKAVIGGRKRNFADMPEDDPMYRTSTNREYEYTDKANKRSVWEVSTSAFHDAHFAVFPPALIVDCIKAGCPEDGVVLDPFMGSGTTAIVSRKLNRNYIGFEINKDYVRLAENRIVKELGMFQ